MARVVWSRVARDDLKGDHFPYPGRRARVREVLRTTAGPAPDELETFPESGRFVPEDPTQSHRELIFGDYRVIYRHSEGTVTIVTVIHGARILQL